MKTVYVLAYCAMGPEGQIGKEMFKIAGVYDTKEECEAAKRPGDVVFETTYFETHPIQMPPWNIKEPDWKIRTTCTGTGE